MRRSAAEPFPALAAVALGSNIPPRRESLCRALALIETLPGTRVKARSRIYETVPEGGPPQGLFLNAAALIETKLDPAALLAALKGIEARMGRMHSGRNHPRPIDLDIIFFGDLELRTPGLEIPHPRFRERGFVLQPLADIIPRFPDPRSRTAVEEIFRQWLERGGKAAQAQEWPAGAPAADGPAPSG